MKLNLLPTYVSKEGQRRSIVLVSVLMFVLSVGACLLMIFYSQSRLKEATDRAENLKPQADQAVTIAKRADTIVQDATNIERNIKLAQAMDKHNFVYPKLYREVLSNVPSFFRVTRISAQPGGAGECTVTMVGVLRTYQQYADLMLALYRLDGATRVSRTGYQITDKIVPPLNSLDQIGIPVRPGEPRVPSDPLARLDMLIAQGSAQNPGAFTGTGGFGTGVQGERGPMPGYSLVTVTVTLATVTDPSGKVVRDRNIAVPNPRDTLRQAQGTATNAPTPGVNPQG